MACLSRLSGFAGYVVAGVIWSVGEDDERRVVVKVGLLCPDARFDQQGRAVLIEGDARTRPVVADLDVDRSARAEQHLAHATMRMAAAYRIARCAHHEGSRDAEADVVECHGGERTPVVTEAVELEYPHESVERTAADRTAADRTAADRAAADHTAAGRKPSASPTTDLLRGAAAFPPEVRRFAIIIDPSGTSRVTETGGLPVLHLADKEDLGGLLLWSVK